MTSTYSPGALVRSRGRDWVVMTPDEADVIRLRPVDGSDEDGIGVFVPLERDAVEPSRYPTPDPGTAGDFTGALLLRDAIRLSLRSGAGPFRSTGRLSVVPRPYQFVPLIMALRLNPIRLLIADDVGVGKTIEAGMIARELLDRGVIRRVGVVCAPHLCNQVWEKELREKFNIETAVIQPSRMARLKRDLPRADIGVFQYYSHLVASIDFVKSERYRGAFIDNAPDLIIVDEAHTAARPRGDRTSVQHQRFDFLRELMRSPDRHLILCTATPHSGVEESFRSLLGLLDPSFDAPEEVDLARAKLVPHLVQRRRADLERWLGDETPFPVRDPVERSYNMSPEYLKLFEDVLEYCRESVSVGGDVRRQQQRVRYWAAIAILRCVLSSPKAAEAMLDKRAAGKRDGSGQVDDAGGEEAFSAQVLDAAEEDEPSDYVPTAPLDDPAAELKDSELRRLNGFLKTAQSLAGPKHDAKLVAAAQEVGKLLQEGYSPIVYCRFIATAKYVAERLETMLERSHPGLRVVSVTGGDGDGEQRAEMVADLANEAVRVLVATDCLSEGVNLQEHFNAVLHYDLPWNPNRLEQREGRVDRYGQREPKVKAVLLYGLDNEMDLVVLDVLIRKARTIRARTGVAVPVPESEQVAEALVDSVLLRRREHAQQLPLGLTDPKVSALHAEWDRAGDREQQARTYFAQHGIKPDEVARELQEMEPALGSARDVQSFVANAIQRFNGELRETKRSGVFELHPGDLRDQITLRAPYIKPFPLKVTFDGIPPEGVTLLGRKHPVVTSLTDAALARALSGDDPQFARCAAIYTDAVQERTAVLVLRLRYLLEEATQQFAEEVVVAPFRRRGDGGLTWVDSLHEEGLRLLREAKPAANMAPPERQQHITWALGMLDGAWYEGIVSERSHALEASHGRLRSVVKGKPLKVTAHTPPDILGCYVLVPAGGGR